MALIGTLRNRLGKLVVFLIGASIVSFVLSDLLGKNSFILGKDNVGEIGGHTISLKEYQQAVQEREANYMMSYNRQPTDRDRPTLQQQAWELLILQYAIKPQIKKAGVLVTSSELEDMIWGENVDANVQQSFTNPQTGLFEKDKVVNYLNQIKLMPETSEPRVRWELFQRELRPGRERIKYENLLIKSDYITTAEAEREYHLQTDVAEVKYLYVPYYTISDSTTKVTDADFSDYYNKNKEKFKTENTRDFNYVSIPVVASAQDSLDIMEDMKGIVADLKSVEDDSVFTATYRDGAGRYSKFSVSSLPPFVSPDSLIKGKVIGPFMDGDVLKVVKVSKIGQDTIENARARHILVKWTDETDAAKKVAMEKAKNILKDLKGGADFAAKAREVSEDPGSATRGGDLGWFPRAEMVKPFSDAVFTANRTGLIGNIVESSFGYHIIDVTHTKTNVSYSLAILEREISPSDATTNEAYRKAETFASDLSGVKEFSERARKDGLNVLEAKGIGSGERRIGMLGEAREIVQWLFNDASVGKVSPKIYELENQNVVAVMTGEMKKGYKPLDAVKEEITLAVKNTVKGKVITDKLNGLKGSLEEIAKSFGTDANVYSSSDLKLSSNTMPTVGFDPQAVGLSFSLENGKRSKPTAGESGVVIMELQNKTIAPAIADYSAYKATLVQNARNRTSFQIADAIKENSDIVDKRYKFY